tara:strand:- start:441 stop:560 length:120 start_codon:yes stop_codon:yes gene_type:complete
VASISEMFNEKHPELSKQLDELGENSPPDSLIFSKTGIK